MRKMSKTTGVSPLPYLDNTETTQNDIFTLKPSSRAILKQKNEKKSTIESLEYYKHLSEKISLTLLMEHSILAERAEKMNNCGTFIETDGDKLLTANFCRQRLCPMCQRRRSLDVAANTKEIVNFLCAGKKRKFLHLTLTVPNVAADELSDTITKMNKAASALFKHSKVKNKFKGVMRCLEVTYNQKIGHLNGDGCGDFEILGNAFHPHFHCLVVVGSSYGSGKNYIKQRELLDIWKECMKDERISQIHIERVKDEGIVSEIAKYCVKPLELDTLSSVELRAVLEVLHSSLHARRLVQLYGEMKEAAKALKIDIEAERAFAPHGFYVERYLYNRQSGAYELSSAAAVAECSG